MAAIGSIAVVIPTLNEASGLAATIATARAPGVEVIVVDGGSDDDTVSVATAHADLLISAPRGRALQMNAGAARAHGDILLFLHADTHLPNGYADAIVAAIRGGAVGGRFDVELVGAHCLLPAIARLMNLRSRWFLISTGDQAIFVRRDVFTRLGGFPEIPLMEDVALSSRLRRLGSVAALHERVATSARRWEKFGVLRTVLLMWLLRLGYALGVSPARLARLYR
jgi:rSAM/selenodomain-associated transferase 2